MGHSSRAIEISKSGLPRSKPASPRLSAQVDAKGMIIILEISSCFYTYIIFVNDQTCIRSRDQYEFVVFSDLDERVLPARANIRFGAS